MRLGEVTAHIKHRDVGSIPTIPPYPEKVINKMDEISRLVWSRALAGTAGNMGSNPILFYKGNPK